MSSQDSKGNGLINSEERTEHRESQTDIVGKKGIPENVELNEEDKLAGKKRKTVEMLCPHKDRKHYAKVSPHI